MPTTRPRADRFCYEGYVIDPVQGEVQCIYSTDGHSFTERYVFGPEGDWASPAVSAAVRILFLLAGVSYYKTTAARVLDLGSTATTAAERDFLREYYLHGLGEFAFRNDLNLRDLTVGGPDAAGLSVGYSPVARRPLIPFGGGIDSIVTVSALSGVDAALCIVHPPGDQFAAIEAAAAVTGLPVVRISRQIDPSVRRSAELGFFNGHVPITAIISAVALVAAVVGGRDAVILSNEWSASVPTLVHQGTPVNHQWSKGAEFEESFARLVAGALGPELAVFSYLRSRSELWVAREFAHLTAFHDSFRSCNRAFHQDGADRLTQWCGVCDKCCFIDLILAPFMSATELREVFGGHEPLDDPRLQGRFLTLLGLAPEAKPFECVGDVGECRAALLLTAARPDRRETAMLASLLIALGGAPGPLPSDLLAPLGPHHIPDRYAPPDLLVRAH
jgi:hypothetical protein